MKQLIRRLILCLCFFNLGANAQAAASFQQSIQQTQQWLQAGKYNLAVKRLNVLYQSFTSKPGQVPNQKQLVVAALLGESYTRLRQFQQAEFRLRQAREGAETLEATQLLAEIWQRYGLMYSSQSQNEAALHSYKKALTYAESCGNQTLAAAAMINLAKYQGSEAGETLQAAGRKIERLQNRTRRRQLLLALAVQAIEQQQPFLAEQALNRVLALQPTPPRQKAQALGYLGLIKMQTGAEQQALQLTQAAILADSSEDLLIRWEQQQALLLKKSGRNQEAIAAYQRALRHIDAIRKDIPVIYQNGRSSFRETLAPVYLGLIDLMLQDKTNDPLTLTEVQHIWERFKTAELNDYFKTLCTETQGVATYGPAQHKGVAILYPIVLPDRLEILLDTGGSISRFRVPVTSAQLDAAVSALYTNIQQIKPLKNDKLLYQWLVKPLSDTLKAESIDIVIYIPDGMLRKVPLALLNDGKHYLIEHYAVVTNPGLSLLSDFDQADQGNAALLSGMSEPGPVVEELISGRYLEADSNSRGLSQDLTPHQRQLRMQSMKQALRLPKVDQELAELAAVLKSPVMKNEQFTYQNFQDAVIQGKNIIHIASHGYFSGDPDSSFVMTYDRLMTMQQFTELFRNEAFLDTPVELITLSACQTAEGDDRAPLGLSGIVVQAGIRSAIGSLWPVDDEAAQRIFANFYRYYQTQGLNKAQALRHAQMDLINLPGFEHPIDWAGFILVGDWE